VQSTALRRFDREARGTTVAREARGALATFLTIAYILFANPAILSAAGMPLEPVVAVTAAGSSAALIGTPAPAVHPRMAIAAAAFAAWFVAC
jgi:AGZA family xanthine/uracil permease-like MFS transporter